mgnify:CR=1 FL=1
MEEASMQRPIARIVCASNAIYLARLHMLKSMQVTEVFRDRSQQALVYAIIGTDTIAYDQWPIDIRRAGITDKLTEQDLRSSNYEQICFAIEARARA